ncbi:MAG: hypothetical protein ACMXYM_01660 [Candidatus Woesearchaeota archaeon]
MSAELLTGLATGAAATNPPFLLIVLIAIYAYYAVALMTIARKIGTPNAWLAFIPVANIYLTWRMSNTPLWTLTVVFFLLTLPTFVFSVFIWFAGELNVIGALFLMLIYAPLLLTITLNIFMLTIALVYLGFSWWWWRIAAQRRYHGAFGLLLTLPLLLGMIPYIGFVFGIIPLVGIGILAWRDQP